jgi:phytoene desaturase
MYLGVKGELPEFEHHNLFFVDDWKANFQAIYTDKSIPESASIYVCKPSASDVSVAPEGHENVFVLVPLPPGIEIQSEQLETLADSYLAQLEKMANVTLSSRITSRHLFGPNDFVTKFHSWQATALGPSHILKQSAIFRTPNVSKKVKGLYYVGGSTTPGIGLPMCLISAELVYKRLARDMKGGPISHIRQISTEVEL